MKRTVLACAGVLLLAACSKSSTNVALPSNDAGAGPQNTVANAGPDTAVGSGAAASSGMGSASAHGASVNESTNANAKPQHHPPAR